MEEQERREQHKYYTDRFVRWQQLTIKHLSFTNHLILGLNLAFLGFLITQTGLKIRCDFFGVIIQIISFLALGASFLAGIKTVLNRLRDFRATSQLVKNKKLRFEHHSRIGLKPNISDIKSAIKEYKRITDKLGLMTWFFLKLQIWTFAIGVFFGIIFLLIEQNACGE